MKKRLLAVALVVILLLSGCAKKEVDINNLEEKYSSVISMPYKRFIGLNREKGKDELSSLRYEEEKNAYYVDKQVMGFDPYLCVNEDNIVKITGFEINKTVDESVVSYITGLYNLLTSQYGSVKIDSSILKRVHSIKDLSMCKNGESYKEVWNFEGFPVEYYVSFENDIANIKIQYNKDPDIKK